MTREEWIGCYGEPCPGRPGCDPGPIRIVNDIYPGQCSHCGRRIIPEAGPAALYPEAESKREKGPKCRKCGSHRTPSVKRAWGTSRVCLDCGHSWGFGPGPHGEEPDRLADLRGKPFELTDEAIREAIAVQRKKLMGDE